MWHGQLMMGEAIPAADFHQLVLDSIAEQNFRYITELLFQLQHSSVARDSLVGSTSLLALVQALSELWLPSELQDVAAAVLHAHLVLSGDCMRELLKGMGRMLPQSAVTLMLAERAYIDGLEDAFESLLDAAVHEHGVEYVQGAVDAALAAPVPVMRGIELILQPPEEAGELFQPLTPAKRVLSPQSAFQLLSACATLPTGELPHTVATYIVSCAANDEELQRFLGSSRGLQDFHFQYVRALLASGDLPGTVASFEGLLDVIQAADVETAASLSDSDAESHSDGDTPWWLPTDPELPPVQALGASVLDSAVRAAASSALTKTHSDAEARAAHEALDSAVQLAHVLMRRCFMSPSHSSLLGLLRLLYTAERFDDMTLLVNTIPQEQVSTGAVLTGHMNLLLRGSFASKGLSAVRAVVQLMEQLGGSVAPDSMTWGFLADACIREGQQAAAQEALSRLGSHTSGSPARLASLQVRLRLCSAEYQAQRGSRAGEQELQGALATLMQATKEAAAAQQTSANETHETPAWAYDSDGGFSDSDASGYSSGGSGAHSAALPRSLRSVLRNTPVATHGDMDAAPFNQIMAEALSVNSSTVLKAAFDGMQQLGIRPGADTLASLLKVLAQSAQDRSGNSGQRLQRTLQTAMPVLSQLLSAGLPAEDAVALADSTVSAVKRSAGRANAFAVFATLHGAGLFGEHLRRSASLDELLPSVSIVDVRHVSPAVRGLYVQRLLWELALQAASSDAKSSMHGRSLHFRVASSSEEDTRRHADWLRQELQATMKLAAPRAEWLVATQQSLVLQWVHLSPWLSAAAALIKQCRVTAITSQALGALAGTKRLPGGSRGKAEGKKQEQPQARNGGAGGQAEGNAAPTPSPPQHKERLQGKQSSAGVGTAPSVGAAQGPPASRPRTVLGVTVSSCV